MKREVKELKVKKLRDRFQLSRCAILTDFCGLSVREIGELRQRLREEGIDYKVVKNTLTYLAVKDTEFEGLSHYLFGPTAIAFSSKEEVLPAKILVRFSKEYKKPQIKGGVLNKEVIDKNRVMELANLPEREVLLSKLLIGMQAPLRIFVYNLNGLLQKLLYALNAIKEQKRRLTTNN
ncbi:MAG: 50S ribosomal protein L10 [bacterium]|nr:50S ribosomal protein L10 [bacterium]